MKYKISQYCIPIRQEQDKLILFNSATSGICKLEESIFNTISSCDFFEEDVPYFDLLRRERYIVPWSMNEFNYIRYNEIKAQNSIKDIESLTFVIAPTTACNFKCVYCFENVPHTIEKMDMKIIPNIVDFIVKQCDKLGTIKKVYLTWFGGEPMLCFDEMKELGRMLKESLSARKIDIDSRIITNGVLLTKERVSDLKRNCNLTAAQITFDGLCDEYCRKKQCSPNDYASVIENILSVFNDISICVRLNVDKHNIKDMYALADMFYSRIGASENFKLYFAMLRDYSNGQLAGIQFFSLEEYYEERVKFNKYLIEKGYIKINSKQQITIPTHKPIYCSLSCVNNFAIGPIGELYKCEHHFGQEDKVIGDVETGLYFNDYYFNHISGVQDELCEKCALYPICQTNCPEIHNLVQHENGICSRYQMVLNNIIKIVDKYCSN